MTNLDYVIKARRQAYQGIGQFETAMRRIIAEPASALESTLGKIKGLESTDFKALVLQGDEAVRTWYQTNVAQPLEEVTEKLQQYIGGQARSREAHAREAREDRGNFSQRVRKYVAVRARQDRFELMQVAEDLGMKGRAAPVYRSLRSIPYLKEKEIKGRKVFDRR